MDFVDFVKTKLQIIVFLCLLFSCGSPRSKVRSWEDNSKGLLRLTKQHFVQKAQEIIKSDLGTYVPDFYERKVFYADHEVVVVFYAPIHLASIGDYYYHGAVVELNSASKSYVSLNNSEKSDSSELWSFYQANLSKNDMIEKIIFQITSYEGTDTKSLFPKNYQLEILEKEKEFMAKVITPNYMDKYHIDRVDYSVISKTSRNHNRPTLDRQGYTEIH